MVFKCPSTPLYKSLSVHHSTQPPWGHLMLPSTTSAPSTLPLALQIHRLTNTPDLGQPQPVSTAHTEQDTLLPRPPKTMTSAPKPPPSPPSPTASTNATPPMHPSHNHTWMKAAGIPSLPLAVVTVTALLTRRTRRVLSSHRWALSRKRCRAGQEWDCLLTRWIRGGIRWRRRHLCLGLVDSGHALLPAM